MHSQQSVCAATQTDTSPVTKNCKKALSFADTFFIGELQDDSSPSRQMEEDLDVYVLKRMYVLLKGKADDAVGEE